MGRRAPKVTAVIVIALAFAIAGASEACRTATQVELVVTYDGMCSDLQEVAIIVGTDPTVAEARIESDVFTTTTSHCEPGSPSRVGSLVVTPNDATGRASIIVLASFGGQHVTDCKPEKGYAGCIVARRAFTFIEHTALTLEIPLETSCKNVPCDAVSTCKSASCVTSDVSCSESGCSEPGVIADGGIEFTDAPTNPDAYVQGLDAQPPPADGSVTDAALEGGSCVTPEQPVSCTTAGGDKTCAVGTTCCYGFTSMMALRSADAGATPDAGADAGATPDAGADAGTSGAGYDCRAPGNCAATANEPTLNCRSAANCPPNSVCCLNMFSNSASCTPAGASCIGGGMSVQTCTQSCECAAGEQCVPGPTVGGAPPQHQLGMCQAKP